MAAWREVLLEVRRKSTGCIFRLRLNIDPNDPYVGISFWEFYDYLARPGDSGREYGYGVSTPYESLEPLVTYLETRTGRTPADTEDLARRLIAAMKVMVERGDLADAMALQANRNLVASWFAGAGVPVEPRNWVWIDSD